MHLHIAHATIHIGMPLASAGEFVTAFADSQVMPGEASKAIITPPAMGEYWQGQGGRFICTMPALMGMPLRALIAGEGEAEDLAYGPRVDMPSATSHIDGAANTSNLLESTHDHPAAKWASNYTADGHRDFFLPARLDLFMTFICAPQLFKKSGWYATSTQYSASLAYVQDFEYGGSNWLNKDHEFRVRPFRVIQL